MTGPAWVFLGAAVVLAVLLVIVLAAYHERPRVVVVNVAGDLDPEVIAARVQNHLDHLNSTDARRGLT